MTSDFDFDQRPANLPKPEVENSGRISIALMDRWLANQASAEDLSVLQGWMADDVENLELLTAFRALRVYDVTDDHTRDSRRMEAALDRVRLESGVGPLARVKVGLDRNDTLNVKPDRLAQKPLWSRYVVYATTLLATVAVVMAGLLSDRAGFVHRSSAEVFTYATEKGERATITLPDGSHVVMNVASQLHVPANYSSGNRTVILDGEALFSVTDHSGSPFTVMAGPSITRVLGTKFVVRHYATDTAAKVLVQDGRVNVHSAVLSSSQQVFVSRHGTGPIQAANAGSLSFSRGVLTLASMSLGDAVTELNRWYDVDIQITDPFVAQERISGEFRAGSITDLAEHLELAFNVQAVRKGRVLILYSR